MNKRETEMAKYTVDTTVLAFETVYDAEKHDRKPIDFGVVVRQTKAQYVIHWEIANMDVRYQVNEYGTATRIRKDEYRSGNPTSGYRYEPCSSLEEADAHRTEAKRRNAEKKANELAVAEAKKAEREKAEREREEAIESWWKNGGQVMWDNAQIVATVAGPAKLITFKCDRWGELRTAMVLVEIDENHCHWNEGDEDKIWLRAQVAYISLEGRDANKHSGGGSGRTNTYSDEMHLVYDVCH